MNPSWLVGVALDGPTWLWLRRKVAGLVAKRLANGYLIIGLLPEGMDDEPNAATL